MVSIISGKEENTVCLIGGQIGRQCRVKYTLSILYRITAVQPVSFHLCNPRNADDVRGLCFAKGHAKEPLLPDVIENTLRSKFTKICRYPD